MSKKGKKQLEQIFSDIAIKIEDDVTKGSYIVENVKVEIGPSGTAVIYASTPIPLSFVEDGEEYCSIINEGNSVKIISGKKGKASPIPLLISTNCTVLFQQEEQDKEENIYNNYNPTVSC